MPNLLYRSDTSLDIPLEPNRRFFPATVKRADDCVNFSHNPRATQATMSALEAHRLCGHGMKGPMTQIAAALGRRISDPNWTKRIADLCHSCSLSDTRKLPFYKENEKLDLQFKPFEAYCMDFKGPKSIISLQGNWYIFLFKEMHAKFSFKVYLPSRLATQYSAWVMRFVAFFERQTGVTTKQIRLDGEFIANIFVDFCNNKGIILKHTTPNEPRLNSVAERDFQTGTKRANAIMLDAKFPASLWEECERAEHALRMVTPHSSGPYKGKSPYEITLKRKFPLDFLRPIGCLVFVRIESGTPRRPMALPGSLTGINIFGRYYRCLLHGQRKIVEARNVKFDVWQRGYTAKVSERPWNFDDPPIPQPCTPRASISNRF